MSNQTIEQTGCKTAPTNPASVVLLADSIQPQGIVELESLGCYVEFDPSLKDESLLDAIAKKNPDILLVRSTKVSEAMMDASERLSLIIRAGAGYDTIDVEVSIKTRRISSQLSREKFYSSRRIGLGVDFIM